MGTSPAQLLLDRRCKTQPPTTKELLKPQSVQTEAIKKKTQARQARQAKYYNRGTRDLCPLEEGDLVRMRPFRLGQKAWEKATVTKRHDERSNEVETESGTYRRNRVDLKDQPTPSRPLEQTPGPPPPPQNKDKIPAEANRLPETSDASQQLNEQQSPPAAVSQRPKKPSENLPILRTLCTRTQET